MTAASNQRAFGEVRPPRSVDARPRADHTVIGVTDSLCPQCMEVVAAKIIVRRNRVYLRKRCPQHGVREDFVCSDAGWWDRSEGQTPSVLPVQRSTRVSGKGCPHDCGLCEDHDQHTCIGLVELTDRCNLSCPMCFASSGPGGRDHSLEDILASLDRLVQCEGRVEVCQLSGGEPTIHPHFRTVVDEALNRPIDYVMINTNGLRLASDPDLVEFLADRRDRVEIYLQWDGQDASAVRRIRGEDVVQRKRGAMQRLEEAGLHMTLVSTLVHPIEDDFYENLWQTALSMRNVVGLSLQPATYSGRHIAPEQLERRVTFPDVIRGLARGSNGNVIEQDFSPLPCAHPNCHQIMLAAREGSRVVPLARAGDRVASNMDLMAGGISFTPERARRAVQAFLDRQSGCGSDCGCGPASIQPPPGEPQASADGSCVESDVATEGSGGEPGMFTRFFGKVLSGEAAATDLFRITITSFLDAYNFDVRQMMKCCTHHVLPSGHVVPFCAYNTLYRPGHLRLPPLSPPSSATK